MGVRGAALGERAGGAAQEPQGSPRVPYKSVSRIAAQVDMSHGLPQTPCASRWAQWCSCGPHGDSHGLGNLKGRGGRCSDVDALENQGLRIKTNSSYGSEQARTKPKIEMVL
jgi:hypothetical protein